MGTVLVGVLFLSGAAFAWQGRMAGMGDPYGLVEDESDFLINPAKISDGQGVKYYGNYRFTYGDISAWKWNGNSADIAGNVNAQKSATGTEYDHEALVGAGFPLGNGRMGVFFNYSGKRSSFDGTTATASDVIPNSNSIFDMKSDFDNFALRAIYGQPVGNWKLGGEVQVGYRREENRFNNTMYAYGIPDPYAIETNGFSGDLLPFILPYDAHYWEVIAKAGVDGNIGPVKTGLTIRGGSIFSGDNDWTGTQQLPFLLTPASPFNSNGGVDGWKLGGDFWARYPYSENLSLPFLVRVDYLEKSRDGMGTSGDFLVSFGNPPFFPIPVFPLVAGSNLNLNSESKERLLQIEVGGGIDWAVGKNTRIASGLYYDYVRLKTDMHMTVFDPVALASTIFDYGAVPNRTEHLARFKVSAESRLNPDWTVRGGLNVFGGTIQEDFNSDIMWDVLPLSTFTTSMDGTHWGIIGSIGATTKICGFTVEPFVQGGYEEINLSDSNAASTLVINSYGWNMDTEKRQAIVGAGVSILF